MQKPTYEELEKSVKELENAAAKNKTLTDIHFLKSLDIVNQAMNKGTEVDNIIDDLTGAVFSIFGCDRIWLFHPCDPNAPTFQVLAEKNKPEYPGAFVSGQELQMTPEAAETISKALKSGSPVVFDTKSGNKIDDVAFQFSVLSQIIMAIHPRQGQPWMLGMHQCSHARIWTKLEQLLFKEISYRVVEGLNNLLLLKALKLSEQKYRHYFETVPNGWAYHKVVLDDDNNPIDYIFLEMNKAFEIQTGINKENVIGKKVTEVLTGIKKDPADWIGRYGKVALTGESVTFENYAEPLKKWFTVTASSPEPGYFITVFEDISERKKLWETLQKSESELQVVTNNVPALIAYVDKNQVYRFTNRRYQKILKHSKKEIEGRTIKESLGEKVYEKIQDHVNEVLSGQRVEFETIMPFENDSLRYMNVVYVPFINEGTMDGFFALIVDITERKKIEEEKEKLIKELQDALAEIKTLRGILPICSFCQEPRPAFIVND